MADQEQDKSESATPFKLAEARKRGMVAKSIDIGSLAVLFAWTSVVAFEGADIVSKEGRVLAALFVRAHATSFVPEDIAGLTTQALCAILLPLAPMFSFVALAAVLSNFVQTGPVFSFIPLKPDIQRLNPLEGFKRLFSIRMLVEMTKTVLKFVILGSVLYFGVLSAMPSLMNTMNLDPISLGRLFLPEAVDVLIKLVMALALIAILDVTFSRWDFARRMRMSRRELRDEYKRREGDPRVKSRLRELQKEILKRARSLGRVKDADVLITNPEHLAVAVKYERERIDAPLVVAKGAGFLAARMRDIARRHRVPRIENRKLARALFYGANIDGVVPSEFYPEMAKILVWVYAARNARAGEARR